MAEGITEEDFIDTNITPEEFRRDLDRLDAMQEHLETVLNEGDFTRHERPAELFSAMYKMDLLMDEINTKYQAPEAGDLIYSLTDLTIFDTGLYEDLRDQYMEASQKVVSQEDQYYQKIEELRIKYQVAQNTHGLTDEERLNRIEGFMKPYADFIVPYVGMENGQQALEEIKRLIGIPPKGFLGDYRELKAGQLKELADKADTYRIEDARLELTNEGQTDYSETDVRFHYLSERDRMLSEALEEYYDFESNVFTKDDDLLYYENIATYSKAYLVQQLDMTYDEQALLAEAKQGGLTAQHKAAADYNVNAQKPETAEEFDQEAHDQNATYLIQNKPA